MLRFSATISPPKANVHRRWQACTVSAALHGSYHTPHIRSSSASSSPTFRYTRSFQLLKTCPSEQPWSRVGRRQQRSATNTRTSSRRSLAFYVFGLPHSYSLSSWSAKSHRWLRQSSNKRNQPTAPTCSGTTVICYYLFTQPRWFCPDFDA